MEAGPIRILRWTLRVRNAEFSPGSQVSTAVGGEGSRNIHDLAISYDYFYSISSKKRDAVAQTFNLGQHEDSYFSPEVAWPRSWPLIMMVFPTTCSLTWLCTYCSLPPPISYTNMRFVQPPSPLWRESYDAVYEPISIGWADSFILAIAPLGVITAVVGAIRVGGPSWLKAIIGRARES